MKWGDWSRSGWEVIGDLAIPETDPVIPEDFEALTEAVWMAVGPGGYAIDIGWYPESDPSGQWQCRVVAPGGAEQWLHPVEEFKGKSTTAMRAWVDAACARIEATLALN